VLRIIYNNIKNEGIYSLLRKRSVFDAVIESCYVIQVKDDDAVSMQLVLGYIGLVNAIICIPPLIILAAGGWGGVTHFSLTIFGFLLLSSFFNDVVADYLWARSVLLTSPTVATVGLSMTIPLAIVTDFLSGLFYSNKANSDALSTLSLCGAGLVLVGFLFVNVGLDPFYRCLGISSTPTVNEQGTAAGDLRRFGKNEYGRIIDGQTINPMTVN
jgi:drug/metabolite transporter (DMT)-like permease